MGVSHINEMLITCWQSNVKFPGQKCLIVQACQHVMCHVEETVILLTPEDCNTTKVSQKYI